MRNKVIIVTLVVAIAAFLFTSHGPLGSVLWPTPVAFASPLTATQGKFFMLLDAFEALAFGLGVAFLLFGWPAVRRAAGSSHGRATVMYLGTAWFLSNWWIHDNLHMVVGLRPQGLLGIEYGFHVTLIIVGTALAYSLVTMPPPAR
jgi:hypothetical protein